MTEEKPTDSDPPPTIPESESPREKETIDPEVLPTLAAMASRKRLGSYEILEEIGRGGMGVVYKAYHPQLKRTVALKVLIAGEDASVEAIARFHREAEAVAKLGHHPHIVPVHDIGEEGNLHFFAMHFVEGKPLDALIDAGEVAPKRAAVMAKKLAEALNHAHGHGVLHRDIKPANVLVTKEGEPQLTDFGLAKDVHAEATMTRSGATMGTPNYMPPEQADGRLADIDERSDVYSLGATLYEMLALRPPFDGATPVQVIQKVVLEDPPSLRKANSLVERDLETICLKCLEKEPARRYASARHLADDLGRFLEGEPILARPASLGYRFAKIVRRHKGLFGAALVFLILLGVGGSAALRKIQRESREKERQKEKAILADEKRRDAEEKEAVAERRKEKNSKVAAVLLTAYSKLGDMHKDLKGTFFSNLLSREEKRVRFKAHEDRLEAFREATAQDATSRATMLAVQGWLYRLGRHDREAKALFREARKTDPEVAWAYLFDALGWLGAYIVDQPWPPYIQSRSGLILGDMPVETAPLRKARERFEALIRRVGVTPEGGPPTDGKATVLGEEKKALRDVFSGFLGVYEGDFARADRGLTLALQHWATAWLEEEVLLARAKIRYLIGNLPGGIEDALEFRKRCPENMSILLSLSNLYRSHGIARKIRGEDPNPWAQKSIDACTEILRHLPGNPAALTNRGVSRKFLCDVEAASGKDPRKTLRLAIRDFEEALHRDPDLLVALSGRGTAFQRLGESEAAAGGDGKKWFLLALQDLEACVRRDPENILFRNNRGITLDSLADVVARGGGDPRELYRKVIADYGFVLGKNPDEVERARGFDPMASFRKALQDFDRMVALEPKTFRAYCRRAEVYAEMAETLTIRGEDPREFLQKALADCRKALAVKGDRQQPYKTQGAVYKSLAEAQWNRNLDPRESFRSSIRSYDEAIRLDPNDAIALSNRGNAWRTFGNALAALREDPRPAYRTAVEDCRRALEINPESKAAYTNLGLAYRGLADEEAKGGGNAVPLYEKALAAYDEALKRNPIAWRAHVNKGLVFHLLGRYDEAIRSFEAALRIVKDNVPVIKRLLAESKAKARSRRGD
ncbi:MAG: protein kinase domain-containing protein [Planctomycetota bacterium]|jgi:serine/threonine-protein kinase